MRATETAPPDPAQRIPMLVGGVTVLVGGAVLTGWALDIAVLKSLLPGWVSMKPNTAVAFLLIGIANLLASRDRAEAGGARAAGLLAGRVAGLLAGLIGVQSLAEYAFDWNPGFDQWLFPEPAGTVGTSHPGRMAPDTAICFALLAVGLEIICRVRRAAGRKITAVILGALVATIGLVEIFSYFSPELRTYGWGGLTMMALPTAVLFFTLGFALVGIAFSRRESAPGDSFPPLAAPERAASLKFVLIFAGLAVGIVSVGAFYYRNVERQFRRDAEAQLEAVANLKVAELVAWRKERLGDGAVLQNNPVFPQLVRRYLASPPDADAQRQLQVWLRGLQTHLAYAHAILLDTRGEVRLTAAGSMEGSYSESAKILAAVLQSGRVTFLDFHREAPDRPIHLGVLVPIYDEADRSRPLGLIVLSIDPSDYLYPFINHWPVPSETAETLLVRREGNEIVFLNELRFQTNTALTRRGSLDNPNLALPAVRAVLGYEGIVNGLDYRGVPVLAAVRTVPDSPWFLVARRDEAEVFSPLQQQLWQVVIFVAILLFGAGAGVGLVWRGQRIRFFKIQAKGANELRDNEVKFRTLFEATTDAHLLFADGRWIDCNRAAEQVFGCRREQILDAHPSQFSPPTQPDGRPSAATAVQLIDQAFRGETQVFEWEHCRLSGATFAAEVCLSRLDLGGKPHLQAVVRDITERKQAELALLTEKANLDAIFETSPVALFILDEQTTIVRVNAAALVLTGGDEAEVLHHRPGNALRCVHSAKDPRGCGYGPGCPLCPARSGIEALLANGRTLHGAELQLVLMRNGKPEPVWLVIGAEPVQLDGRRHLCVAMEDITRRKRTAMINRARLHLIEFSAVHSLDELLEESLNEAEELSGSVIGFYHFVEADQVTLTLQNWSTRTKVEFCRAEGKGRHYDIDQAGVWVDCVHQRKPVVHNDYASLPHRKGMPEGHAVVIRELVVPVMQGEKVMAILGVRNKPILYTSMDVEIISELADLVWQITVRKRAEDEVHQLNSLLEQRVAERTAELATSNKELESFSYSVSHDLRTPLRSIDGFSRLLMEDSAPQLDDAGRDNLNRIRAAAQRMGQLIDDLLSLSRIGRTELSWAPFDMAVVAREVVATLRQREPARRVEVVVPAGLMATGDVRLLRIALENLLGNAWKFTGKCAAPRIEVGVEPNPPHSPANASPIFFVRDNGAGFDPAYADKLFGAFQRLHGNAEFPGTGIGLATVQRIIRRHGGRIWAEAQVDQGATFYFTLRGSAVENHQTRTTLNP